MKSITIILVATILLSSCSARTISQSAIASALLDIMSPANTDQAMQLMNMANTRANQNIAMPNRQRTVIASNDFGLPARALIARNEMQPGRIITNEMGVPRAIITNDGMTRMISNEMGVPRAIITNDGMKRMISNEQRVFTPEIMYPEQQNVVRQVVREVPSGNLIDSLTLPKEIYQTAPMELPQENFVYPCGMPASAPNPYLPASPSPNPFLPAAASAPNPYMPFGIPNPYLPVASPVSAMSSPFMPPPTQSKGQFLRKIPISPPTL